MRVLATAHPNKKYRWYGCLEKVTIQAVLINNKIRYYELNGIKQRRIAEENVNVLFPAGALIKDRPFLRKENRDFFIILKRKKVKFKEDYRKLKRK